MKGLVDGIFTLNLNEDWTPPLRVPETKKSEEGSKPKEEKLKTTYCESILHIFRGTVGTGILSLPSGFSQAGYLGGIITVVVTNYILNYCSIVLIESHNELSRRRKGSPQFTYRGTIGAAIEDGPKCLRRCKIYIEHIVNVLLLINQFGGGVVYVIFMGINAQMIFRYYIGDYSLTVYILAMSIPLVATNMILRLKGMTFISAFGNTVILCSILYIFYYCLIDGFPAVDRAAFGSLSGTLYCLGVAFFASGCTTMVLPLNSDMKHPGQLTTLFGVLNVSTTGIAMLYSVFGWVGYLKFGSSARETVTLNLEDDMAADIVNLALIVSTLTSFALSNYITHNVLWNDYVSVFFVKRKLTGEYVLKCVIVITQIILAILVPNMSYILSFTGTLFSCTLGLAMPCLVSIFTFYDKEAGFWKTVISFYKEIIIIIASCAILFM